MRSPPKRLGAWTLLLVLPNAPWTIARLQDPDRTFAGPAPPELRHCPRDHGPGPPMARASPCAASVKASGLPYWKAARSPHFILLAQADRRKSLRLCARLEEAHGRICALLGVEPPGPLRVLAFRRPEQLHAYLGPGPPARYDPVRRQIVAALDEVHSPGDLAHALAHAVLEQELGWRDPPGALEEAVLYICSQFPRERPDRGARPADPAPG